MSLPGPAGASSARIVEEAVERSERRLRTLFESIDEGYCLCEMVVDHAGRPVDYRFLEVNPLFEEMTGLADPVGRTALELVADLEPAWVQTYARVGLGREPLRFEMGSEAMSRWFDVFAVPVEPHGHFAIVFKDQTDRRQAELALLESEERFRTMADQLPLLVWHHDAAGQQDWVNQRFCSYFGVRQEEMTGERWADVLHPEDGPGYVADFASAVAQRRPFNSEVRVRRADGTWRWLESWAHPQFAAGGTYLGHLGTSADITERKAAEAALRSAAAVSAFRAGLVATLRTIADPVQVQAEAARRLGEHLGADRVHYAEIDEKGEYGVVHADHHPGVPSVVGVHRLDDYGPAVMAEFRAGKTLVVEDVAADPRLDEAQRAMTAALMIGSYVMAPLEKFGRPVAALVVHRAGAHRWTDEELAVIHDTGAHTWAAVEQTRAENALRVRHARAELVADLLSDLEGQPTVAAQLQRLAELLVPKFADYATVEAPGRDDHVLGIAHRDPDQVETLRLLRERRLDPDDAMSVAGAAAGASQLLGVVPPAVLARFASDPEVAVLLDRLRPRSHMAVPLDLGGEVNGVLVVGLTDPSRPPYGSEDLVFLQETAQRVGVVVAAARLRQEEHDISVRLQQALLPDELIWHPNVVVEARYQAAGALLEVGGDWYDTFAWPDGRIGVMVGDVVGHNLDSAAAMGRLRAATAALAAHTAPSPAALIEALEHFALGPNGTDFATAVCVVIDPETGRLAYSSAGHPPVIVLAPGQAPVRLQSAQSLPLCALSTGPRPEATVELEPGSLVVLYSDGLVERRRQTLDAGISRLEALIVELAGRHIGELADRVIADMAADAPPDDDVVVACFRYAPATARFRRIVDAQGDRLAGLRAEMRDWLTAHGTVGVRQHHVLLAVGEACANAIEHAYLGTGQGIIDVELTHHGDHLTAAVRDRGTWRPASGRRQGRGRGTHIMRSLAHTFARQSGPDGTTVTFTQPVGAEGEVPR